MKLNNKINFLDLLLLITLASSLVGYVSAKSEKIPSLNKLAKIIEGKENIGIDILLPDVPVKNDDYFKVGEKAGVTIRNRPYTKLTIVKSESKPKQVIIPTYSGTFKTINDPTKQNVKDYYVTLSDMALKTADGYVLGGNKIKIGNQVELEGFNYRLSGKVVNVYPIQKSSAP